MINEPIRVRWTVTSPTSIYLGRTFEQAYVYPSGNVCLLVDGRKSWFGLKEIKLVAAVNNNE